MASRFAWCVLALLVVAAVQAEAPRVLPEGEKPNDRRLQPLKDLDGYFPFDVPESKDAWLKRREEVRRQALVANGLWPMPPRPAVEATVHGTVDRDEYTVSKVFFETAPGLFVTGSIYRPKQGEGPFPAVLSPHGHWADGRFFAHSDAAFKGELDSGAEKFETGGRYPLQARCVQLARMGCIVFHYDMLGYADSVPLTQELAHGFKTQRPELSKTDRWGLFSAQSELRLINALGLQTWNSLRALDWIASLPEVDASRIGVTGASGGGTQTFLLGAIDDRPAALFPAVMVSTAMQGGCTCENASYLRVGTGNIELAAAIAPRPLGMTAANDWTKELETKGLPELKRLYTLMGVPDRVEGRYFDFGHNYNAVSRRMMYEFFKAHLALQGDVEERDFQPLSREELTVWNSEHPKPAMDEAAEVALMQALDARNKEQMASLVPKDAASLAEFRKIVGGAYDVMIGRTAETLGNVTVASPKEGKAKNYVLHMGRVQNATYGEEIPTVVVFPATWQRKVVVWPHPQGKSALFDDAGEPIEPVRKLVDAGYAVMTADLVGQGEFTDDGKRLSQAPVVKNPREFAGYTLGYNHPLFSKRVQDVMTLLQFAKDRGANDIVLLASDEAAAWSAAACAQSGGLVTKLALAPGDFRFANITDIRDPNFLPGAVKYGDLPALLALCAPTPTGLFGETVGFDLTKAAYDAAGKSDALTTDESAAPMSSAAIEWVIGK
ncbi:MAG: acetylxylan esterase [Planctomycetaceae bacterium]|nr:acetylxylan esterase [Planctomycetaceae bacterium]